MGPASLVPIPHFPSGFRSEAKIGPCDKAVDFCYVTFNVTPTCMSMLVVQLMKVIIRSICNKLSQSPSGPTSICTQPICFHPQ